MIKKKQFKQESHIFLSDVGEGAGLGWSFQGLQQLVSSDDRLLKLDLEGSGAGLVLDGKGPHFAWLQDS